jgi:periodic tryptophan protein 1
MKRRVSRPLKFILSIDDLVFTSDLKLLKK